jgi:hypothetical protein
MPMQKMSVHAWFIVGVMAAASTGCGVEDRDASTGEDTVSGITSVTAAVGSTCSPSGLASPIIRRTIGYGEMGKHGIYDWAMVGGTLTCAAFKDQCDTGLWPHNVDTQSTPAYAKAAPGNFSCWGNTPDVICWQHPQINDYIYVRHCYVRPDGSRVDYGCGCWGW